VCYVIVTLLNGKLQLHTTTYVTCNIVFAGIESCSSTLELALVNDVSDYETKKKKLK